MYPKKNTTSVMIAYMSGFYQHESGVTDVYPKNPTSANSQINLTFINILPKSEEI
ncbi:hypothetical protein IQ247_00915 [Plectonema cf. radiosum LEGE 06105]|uniref:Uncharacterized protein n=1 Tax=Plectonema cf. radiosum LEGE 06105 TaxID=945769 RepID=A0A8J7EZI0_9CYAN|nr:hypothetical protein [Plectonema radiosum]MBE9211293.1 hypothetical protein [Plectonema cf. radiosum LEGE 06105]